ncbi:HAD hydrolase-like protein [Winkia sp. C62]|uniref:HAD hydrolase-like protein n=2 Tax=Nanchangia anserum TaxID=2692125 RepID=A0A8I0GAU2_9ACTO|nr:HAD hydrolase-like protein [Nanchangia anserum]
MAGSLLDVDAEAAYRHAQAAVSRASRIGEVREAAALAAYACGKYTEALREVRTARRLSGSDVLRAVEADCERGLGKPEKALDIIADTDTSGMDEFELAELAIVAAGARADMEQHDAALIVIDDFLDAHSLEDDEALARLLSVKADVLMELGREDEADEVRASAPVLPEAVTIVDLEEVAEADTTYVASDLHGSRRPLVEAHDLVMVDLDGVCYMGTNPIEHARDGLQAVRDAGTALAFVTNNASRTPQAVVDHLATFSISAQPDEIMTAALDGVEILKDKLPPAAKVLIVGGEGVHEAVEAAGFTIVTSADDKPAAVIQGYAPDVDWVKMSEATYAINAGAAYVATNLDATLPTERGFAIGNGSLVACVSNATGVKPYAGGKPFASIYRRPVERAGASHPLAVGDRLNTDIRGARAAGYRSLHVLTGVSNARDVALAEREERPDFLGLDLRALGQPHPGAVKNPTKEWTSGGSAGFRVDHEGHVLRDGDALSTDALVLDLPDYRAFIAAVWEARDNGTYVDLPAEITVVEAYPDVEDTVEGTAAESDGDSTVVDREPEPAENRDDSSEAVEEEGRDAEESADQ